MVAILAGTAAADTAEHVVRAGLVPVLPPELGIAAVHVPRSVASLDIDPATASVVATRALRAGRPSVKLVIAGRAPVYVPVSLVALTRVAVASRPVAQGTVLMTADVIFELRPARGADATTVIGARTTRALASGDTIGASDVAQEPPIGRGTEITIEARRGGVRIRSAGKLELAARLGTETSARVTATGRIVRGTLVDSTTLIVGDSP